MRRAVGVRIRSYRHEQSLQRRVPAQPHFTGILPRHILYDARTGVLQQMYRLWNRNESFVISMAFRCVRRLFSPMHVNPGHIHPEHIHPGHINLEKLNVGHRTQCGQLLCRAARIIAVK